VQPPLPPLNWGLSPQNQLPLETLGSSHVGTFSTQEIGTAYQSVRGGGVAANTGDVLWALLLPLLVPSSSQLNLKKILDQH
jgi:hypothetical protein